MFTETHVLKQVLRLRLQLSLATLQKTLPHLVKGLPFQEVGVDLLGLA